MMSSTQLPCFRPVSASFDAKHRGILSTEKAALGEMNEIRALKCRSKEPNG